jgi:hypothetical protein
LAGIGNPLKVFTCVVSMLNFASRKAPHIGIITGNKSIIEASTPAELTIIGEYIESELLSS